MAKKKEVEEGIPVDKRTELAKLLLEKYGNIATDGSYIKDHPKRIIPTTPILDIALSGGIPEGSWTLITGKPKTGKTTLALQMAANAQKLYSKHVYYLDVEHRFGEKNLSTVRHLKTDGNNFTIIKSPKDRKLPAEEFLSAFEDIADGSDGSVIIIDSISMLCAQKEQVAEITGTGRAAGPKLIAETCRKLASVIPSNNITVIAMLHVIANTSGYGASSYEDGGNKIQYIADTKIACKGMEKWEKGSGDNAKVIGQMVKWNVAFSALGTPQQNAECYLRYGYGYDDVWEIITLACDFGIIQKGGAWFTYFPEGGEPVKVQGQEKLYEYLSSRPEECDKIYSLIKAMVE